MATSNLMINLGASFEVFAPDQARPFITCADSWWVGLWDTYHSVDWPESVCLFGIHFKPGGAYPFLQLPLAELTGRIVPLDAIWGRFTAEVREQLRTAPTIQAGFALLERLLLARLGAAPRNLEVVQYALSQIAQHHGALSIRALSEQVGISQNHLVTQFKRLVGVPPKEAARFYRFAHVLCLLDAAQPVDLTQIAHRAQFYDQSHFNREFSAFTGHSPTDYVQLRRRVQVENPEHARAYRNLPVD
jgi:AraC-like DNA-binding protein